MKQESVSLACRETLRISASFADFPIGFREGEPSFFLPDFPSHFGHEPGVKMSGIGA